MISFTQFSENFNNNLILSTLNLFDEDFIQGIAYEVGLVSRIRKVRLNLLMFAFIELISSKTKISQFDITTRYNYFCSIKRYT